MRDPDGYYIEFCNCASLDEFLHKKPESEAPWTLSQAASLAKARQIMKRRVSQSKAAISIKNSEVAIADRNAADAEVGKTINKVVEEAPKSEGFYRIK